MADVKATVNITNIEMLVCDTAAETVKKVSTRFPYKVKASNRLLKTLTEQVEAQGLKLVDITSINTEKKRYSMPVEMFVTLGHEIEE